jgi:hypothetical protein
MHVQAGAGIVAGSDPAAEYKECRQRTRALSRPDLVEGFTQKTFTAMIAGIRDAAIGAALTNAAATFDEGIRALLRTTELDRVFCYTFFKVVGWKG